MKKIVPLLAAVLMLAGASTMLAVGQAKPKAGPPVRPALERPDGRRAMAHIAALAADEMKGRQSGTAEYRKAAEYVAARFKELGLQPAGDAGAWFQEVPIRDFRTFVQPVRLEITRPQRRTYFAGRDRDFDPVAGTGTGVVTGQLAFAGFGIASDAPGWNDYDGLDVKGRIVMILPGAPPGMSAGDGSAWTLAQRARAASDRGAVGLILMDVVPAGPPQRGMARARLAFPRRGDCPEGFVVMRASQAFCDDAFYVAGKSWRYHVSRMMRDRKPSPAAIDTAVEMEVHAVWEDRTAPNVIGVMPGTDPILKNEYIVFGGHLDHLGVGANGFVYPGADDDATSTATILEVVRVLRANNVRPRRTLVFAAWMGEEMGLRGSAWYTEHAPFPIEKTVYVNIDMVGTGDTDLWVGGLYEYSDLFDIIRPGLDPDIAARLHARLQYTGSDHTSFNRKGVTSISLRSGNPLTPGLDDEHPEYHKPGDRAEYIQPELLELAALYHYQVITTLANTDRNLLDPVFRTRYIHRDATVADMHSDTIGRFMEGEDLKKDLPAGHIDIPKLKRGSVDLQVFAAYVAVPRSEAEKHTAAKRAFDQIDAVHRLVGENPDDLALVLGPVDFVPLKAENRTGILISIEGGYAIENDLSLLRAFHKAGVRLMTLTHWNRTDWADASGDEKAELGGLTAFGEQVVREMNRLGMIVDVSHVHDETFWDVLKVTTKPVVASHSCARGLSDHFRNLSDGMLKALAANGGVVGINFAPGFLNAALDKAQSDALAAIAAKYTLPADRAAWDTVDPALRARALAELKARTAELEKTVGVVDVKTVVDHIDHVVKVTGSANHVGLGSDFDGISTTPKGLENVGTIMAITEELRARGYSEADVRKILGDNVLRVFWAAMQGAAAGPR